MPYIDAERRETFDDAVDDIAAEVESPGELNYIITRLLLRVLQESEANYGVYNAFLGVLTAVQLELYRRWIAVYEDEKIIENGDIELWKEPT